MNFDQSDKSNLWLGRVSEFMDRYVYPAIPVYVEQSARIDRWKEIPPIFEELKAKARAAGLWNMFMPPSEHDDEFFTSVGLTNVEYAPIAELMGRVSFASEIFNCMAPDTGNMEVLHRYGTPHQKRTWLTPLANGDIRSAFLMTEPDVASSDARNIRTQIRLDGDEYVINGRKWWSSGVGHPHCGVLIVMGKTDPNAPTYRQQSMIIVPPNTPGIKVVRYLPVFGYDHAPHGHFEVILDNVRVPKENLLLGEGRGFEIAQGRLGPGRIHHAMRTIASAEVALERICVRLQSRTAFGKKIAEHSVWEERIAEARMDIEMTRLLCLKAAHMMDTVGNKTAFGEIAMITVAAPRTALRVMTMSACGGFASLA